MRIMESSAESTWLYQSFILLILVFSVLGAAYWLGGVHLALVCLLSIDRMDFSSLVSEAKTKTIVGIEFVLGNVSMTPRL